MTENTVGTACLHEALVQELLFLLRQHRLLAWGGGVGIPTATLPGRSRLAGTNKVVFLEVDGEAEPHLQHLGYERRGYEGQPLVQSPSLPGKAGVRARGGGGASATVSVLSISWP